jgi:hypothetical protein
MKLALGELTHIQEVGEDEEGNDKGMDVAET